LLVACIVGDGETETGPTATAWHCPKFLDPADSGAVLPVDLKVRIYRCDVYPLIAINFEAPVAAD
jgi:phosphoketolase